MTLLGGLKFNPRDILRHHNVSEPTTGTWYRRNLPRTGLTDLATALTTQVMTSTPIWLEAGDVVTNITAISGGTALATGTNWWFALYSSASTPAKLAQTADQTSTAWAANTVKTVALASAQTISTSGVYWVGIHVKASAVPSLLGSYVAKAVLTGERNLAQTSGSSLTDTAPSTIATPTAATLAPLVILS